MIFGVCLAVLMLIPVWVSSQPEARIAFGMLAVGVFAMTVWILQIVAEVIDGRVRIQRRGPLAFASHRFAGFWGILAGLAITAGALVFVIAWLVPGARQITSVSGGVLGNPVGFVLVGLGLLGFVLHRGVPAAGLVVEAQGVRSRIGLSTVQLKWDDLLSPVLLNRRRHSVLSLELQSGANFVLYPIYFGSDPVIVAEVIEYYRTHPEDRHLLADPLVALQRVVELAEAPA